MKYERILDLLRVHFCLSRTSLVHFLTLYVREVDAKELIDEAIREKIIAQHAMNLRFLEEHFYTLPTTTIVS